MTPIDLFFIIEVIKVKSAALYVHLNRGCTMKIVQKSIIWPMLNMLFVNFMVCVEKW